MTLREKKRHRKIMEAKRKGILGEKMHHTIINKNRAWNRDAIEEYPDLFKPDDELL